MAAIIGLALLAVPRVVLHDLGVLQEGTFVNAVFVFLPPLVWIGVAVWTRVPNPFLTLLTVGACYGVFLAVTHQLLWGAAWGEAGPSLGGNLRDLAPGVQAVLLRGFAVVSSLFTGVVVGALSGLVAWVARRVLR
ncbi:hypothetical protein [Thermoactinospora rubra]|uniref:hypothetical protein n=1 Tax=Thermoactinospora rubra TaxID=1088767 RepID=UPI000A0FF6FB|nr:hypothetical protein [Thermoactinospora rubra]